MAKVEWSGPYVVRYVITFTIDYMAQADRVWRAR